MFFKKNESELESEVNALKLSKLKLEKEKQELKEELADLKLKKKIEEEDIKHMVKINSERKDIELEKEKLRLTQEKNDEIASVKDSYRDKTEQQLEKQLLDMRSMYSEILTRLPNYNIKHKISENG